MPAKGVKRVKRAKEPGLGEFKGDEKYNRAVDTLESRHRGMPKKWVIRIRD
jgi:hypothetical protein